MINYLKSLSIFESKKKDMDNVKLSSNIKTFAEKVIEVEKEENFVYFDEASQYPNLPSRIQSNDDLLQTSKGQLFNAKGEFFNGLKHAVYAAGNTIAAGWNAFSALVSLHNSFAMISNAGNIINEVKDTLQVGVEAEKLLHKAQDTYNRLTGVTRLRSTRKQI